jgi:hypothetical protein
LRGVSDELEDEAAEFAPFAKVFAITFSDFCKHNRRAYFAHLPNITRVRAPDTTESVTDWIFD